MRSLVVDNDIYAVKILTAALNPFTQCDIVFNGTEAAELILSSLKANPYDVVFLDIMLPGHDGLSVLRIVREGAKLLGQPAPRIVLLSALEDEQTIIQAFRDGCSGYIVKPFNRAAIVAELEKLGLVNSFAPQLS